MAQTHHLSPSAHTRLAEEYHDLTTRGRIEIAHAIERARELGDLKENGDYHAAKEQQGMMEGTEVPEHHREFLERAFGSHVLVGGTDVNFRSIVTILYDGDDESDAERFLIGHTEESSEHAIITPDSPIGKALIGKKVDDRVEYEGPRGKLTVHVRHVEPV